MRIAAPESKVPLPSLPDHRTEPGSTPAWLASSSQCPLLRVPWACMCPASSRDQDTKQTKQPQKCTKLKAHTNCLKPGLLLPSPGAQCGDSTHPTLGAGTEKAPGPSPAVVKAPGCSHRRHHGAHLVQGNSPDPGANLERSVFPGKPRTALTVPLPLRTVRSKVPGPAATPTAPSPGLHCYPCPSGWSGLLSFTMG